MLLEQLKQCETFPLKARLLVDFLTPTAIHQLLQGPRCRPARNKTALHLYSLFPSLCLQVFRSCKGWPFDCTCRGISRTCSLPSNCCCRLAGSGIGLAIPVQTGSQDRLYAVELLLQVQPGWLRQRGCHQNKARRGGRGISYGRKLHRHIINPKCQTLQPGVP